MNCRTAQGLISSYLDRELSPSDLMNMRAHLAICAGCQAELESMTSLKSMLTSITTPEPDADFEARLMRAVRTSSSVLSVPKRPWYAASPFVFAGIAACSMLLTLGAISLVNRQTSGPTASTHNIAFEVQRDQIYAAGGDPSTGAPISAAIGGP